MDTRVIIFARYLAKANQLRGLCLLIAVLLLGNAGVVAQAEQGTVREVRTLYPSEWSVPHPFGVAYATSAGQLFLLDKGSAEPSRTTSTVVAITPYEDLVGSVPLEFTVDDAINVAYNDADKQLFLYNNQRVELAQVGVGDDGLPAPQTLTRFGLAHLGLTSVTGMAVDLINRRLLLLDSGAAQIVSANLDNGFGLLAKIDLAHIGATSLRGLALHPLSQNLFVLSPLQKLLYELTQSGELVHTYDLAVLALVDAGGLAFGPSADLTDAPETIHLFMVDSHVPADGPAQEFGRLLEVALEPKINTGTVRFAVIGDYGRNNADEGRVAALVAGWNPDFVITTGDNNYPDGEVATIDDAIGQYYSPFIGNYQGAYGPGSATNRFWPVLGNHDWHTLTCSGNSCSGAYFDYFTLPNNERYYATDLGLVHLFALDSESEEPDGRDQNSLQAAWLQTQLASSTACYNLVYFHRAPYGSGRHGSHPVMQWPFAAWGADAIFSGHDHLYERLDVGGMPYFVNGAGGAPLYTFDTLGNLPPEAASIVRYNQDYGAMLVTATTTGITYQFYNANGVLIDEQTVTKDCLGASPDSMPTPTATITATLIATPTATVTVTNTLTPTDTPTVTDTLVNTPTPTDTPEQLIDTAMLTNTTTEVRAYLSLILNSTEQGTTVSPSADITSLTFAAEADARVLQTNPTTNYGTSSKLSVDSPGEDSYLRFTVTGAPGPVQSATLRLFAVDSSSNGPAVYGAGNSWTETGITWNNRPAATTGAVDNKGAIALNTWVDYNVTTLVTGNGTYSFVLIADSTQGISLRSRESTSPPQLVLTFVAGATPTPTNTPTNTPIVANTPTNTATASATPTPTNTPIGTQTPTNTATPSATATPTNTPTNTMTPSTTATNTNTPIATNTPTNTATPSVTSTPTNTPLSTGITLAAEADARVQQANPTTNYGTSSKLDVDSPGVQSYVRFTVSGVTGSVQSAMLRLFVTNGSSDAPSLYTTDNNWTETGITWNNRPAATSGAIADIGAIVANTWAEYNVTAQVSGNGTYNFVLLPDSNDGISFSAREATPPLQLILTFLYGPTPTPGPSPTPTNTPTQGPTPTPTNTPDGSSVVFVGAGDIADCNRTSDEATALLLDNIPGTVFTIGDNAYPNSSAANFADCYQPTWGRHKARTHPTIGDNEYNTSGATGYFNYFGAAAGDPTKGYYSYNVGSWHIIALNSNCSQVGGCGPTSPQGQWLQADLNANPRACILAIHHEPLFSSKGGDSDLREFWAPLYAAGADIVLSGHRHNYERFARQNPDGVADPAHGIRQFVAGMGGTSLSAFNSGIAPNSEVRNGGTYGVLKLTLHPTSYDWAFVPIAGQTFTDTGSTSCVTP